MLKDEQGKEIYVGKSLDEVKAFAAAEDHTVVSDPYRGGRHGETKGPKGDNLDSHHMPADAINGLPKDEGPAIQMEPKDHAETASNGGTPGSDIYRARQQRLIDQGHFGEAIQMDIDDIRDNFGTKYDAAIKEMISSLDPWMKKGLKG